MTFSGHWEPATSRVLNSFAKWLMINPSPTWLLTDAGVQYTSDEFQQFCMNSGIGLMTAPAEAHWILGAEEGAIGILKASVKRLLNEEPSVGGERLCIGGPWGQPCHWALGILRIGGPWGQPCHWALGILRIPTGPWRGQDPLPSGLEPWRAFGGILRLKEMARIAFEQEHAKYKLSKLSNALRRSPTSFKSGDLVMIWRQRMKPGKDRFVCFCKREVRFGWAAAHR